MRAPVLLSAVVLTTTTVVTMVFAMGGEHPSVKAAFLLLAPSGPGQTVPLARVILDGVDRPCPALRPASGKKAEVILSPRVNPDEDSFPVTVCEAVYPASGKMQVKGSDIVLPSLATSVDRVTVFGDTGCKPRDQHGCKQGGARHWPFNKMSDIAAERDPGPELLLHVGDYNYRGTPGSIQVNGKTEHVYDAGDNTLNLDCKLPGPYFGQNSRGSDSPDKWENWWKDFFEPAQRLLTVAPWVFARGNHELCSRAGMGWFYLLDVGSGLLDDGTGQLACPPADSEEPLIFRPPYRVDLGGLSVLVLDSANACDQGDLHQRHFDDQFKEIAELVREAPDSNAIWLQSHRPLWGVRKADDNTPTSARDPTGQYAFIDRTLQSAYAESPLPKRVHLVLSGHMHRFQAIGFSDSGGKQRPAQLVVGNGGVALAQNHPEIPFSFPIDGMTGTGFGLSEFGYLEIELPGSGAWRGRLLGREGSVLAKCDSTLRYKSGVCARESE